jgi:SAM-dependent methyltransferase
MGIHPHTLMFLKFASKKMSLGRVATMGRQGMYVLEAKLRTIMGARVEVSYGPYCEDFLKAELGATTVESFDRSAYECATHIFDFNLPITTDATYDTILDGGFLEHIFNVPQALENMSRLCAEGGQILHVLPANNLCGHGFWQFTPELFFAVYAEHNGYAETQVFLADVANENEWYEVRRPSNGESVLIVSSAPVWLLVRTRRTRPFLHQDVQQSHYVHVWSGKSVTEPTGSWAQHAAKRMAQAAKENLIVSTARYAERKWQELLRPGMSVSAANPNLQKRVITTLL